MLQSRTIRTFILSASRSIVALSGLVLLVVLSRQLPIPEYGSLKQLTSFGKIVLPILLLGLPQALLYFIPLDDGKEFTYLKRAIIWYTLAIIIFGFALYIFSDQIVDFYNNPSLQDVLILLAVWLWASGIIQLSTSALNANNKHLISALVSAGFSLLNLVVVSLYALEYDDFRQIFLVYSVVSASLALLSLTLYIKNLNTDTTRNYTDKAVFEYSFPLLIASYLSTFGSNISLLIVPPFLSVSEFGVFSNGAMELPLVGIITGSAMTVIIPESVKLYRENNLNQFRELWTNVIGKTAFLIFPLTIFFFYKAEDFMVLLFTTQFQNAAIPFKVLLLLLPLRIVFFSVVFMMSNNGKLLTYRTVGTALLSAIFGYAVAVFFNPFFTPLGLVLATYLWALPFNAYWYYKIVGVKLHADVPWSILISLLLKSTLSLLVIIAIENVMNVDSLLVRFILTATIFFLIYGILNYKTVKNEYIKIK